MPKLTLPEALRYFFSSFVIMFYFCIYDPYRAKLLIRDFGPLPAVAALVAGVSVYYVYRYTIYDDLIMPLYDSWRRNENHRLLIIRRYNIPRHFFSSTRIANKVLHELADDKDYIAAMEGRQRPMRSGGVHLLFQSAIWALVFGIISLANCDWTLPIIFISLGAVQIYTAVRMDMGYEDEEFLVLSSMLETLDKAAAKFGFRPNSQSDPDQSLRKGCT